MLAGMHDPTQPVIATAPASPRQVPASTLAIDAAWNWRFNAGRNGATGEKVEGWVRVPVNFSPDKPADEATAG